MFLQRIENLFLSSGCACYVYVKARSLFLSSPSTIHFYLHFPLPHYPSAPLLFTLLLPSLSPPLTSFLSFLLLLRLHTGRSQSHTTYEVQPFHSSTSYCFVWRVSMPCFPFLSPLLSHTYSHTPSVPPKPIKQPLFPFPFPSLIHTVDGKEAQ
ncbi:hypothetical protein F5H01DRAFT_19842 [Linnemannia elongata]|nr:hypothetical protein F5H01DRAFT_19842 [Linnemannia elongata]